MSDRRSQAAVLFLVGAMALYLGGSDAALAHVTAGLQPHGPRVAWLLALPPLALVLIAPPALGAFAASRQAVQPPPTMQASPAGSAAGSADSGLFPPLPRERLSLLNPTPVAQAADGDRMVEAATEARMLSPSTHRQNASPPAGY